MNKAQIIGNVGRDPEVRYMQNGDAVCNFSVATARRWKDKATGEAKEETTWHRVTAFGRQAEIVGEYLRQGSKVYIEGEMTQRKYTDQSGAEKVSHEIRMQEMEMLGDRQQRGDGEDRPARAPAPQQGGARNSGYRQAPAPAPIPRAPATTGGGSGFDDMSDDIPF